MYRIMMLGWKLELKERERELTTQNKMTRQILEGSKKI
jgi:hypothetical protein